MGFRLHICFKLCCYFNELFFFVVFRYQYSIYDNVCILSVLCFIIFYHYFIKKEWTTEGWSGSMLLCDYFSCILRKGVATMYILVLFCLFRRATPADGTARCLPAAKWSTLPWTYTDLPVSTQVLPHPLPVEVSLTLVARCNPPCRVASSRALAHLVTNAESHPR